MSTKAIEQFLQTAYTDERLAMLLAHAEDGKLVMLSCCCLIGIPTADHALRGSGMYFGVSHYDAAKQQHQNSRGIVEAEGEFFELSPRCSDAERRTKLIPLIRAEMDRRASLRSTQVTCDTRDNNVTEELAGVFT